MPLEASTQLPNSAPHSLHKVDAFIELLIKLYDIFAEAEFWQMKLTSLEDITFASI